VTTHGAQFWLVTPSAAACLLLSGWLLAVAWRRRLGELAVLGGALSALSAWSVVHGLTTPNQLYGDAPVSAAAAVLALLACAVGLAPLAVPAPLARQLLRGWRPWVVATVGPTAAGSGLLLTWPALAPTVPGGDPLAVAAQTAAVVLIARVAFRQLYLFRLGRRSASLVVAVALAGVAVGQLAAAWGWAGGLAWWTVHVVNGVGVLGAGAGLLIGHRRDAHLLDVLAPITTRDPLAIFELGLSTELHSYVTALERKDHVTRHHVIRVGELAMRVGLRAGLPPARLRTLGTGALLHDIGKLAVDDAVLNKPGRLTPPEFAQIQMHTEIGESIIAGSPILSGAAAIVRWHHEKYDGTGYPDGLAGEQIPLEVAIVSVCDAWDAMTHDRQYRPGMSLAQAEQIMREGAGSQWNPEAVQHLLHEVAALRAHAGTVPSPAADAAGAFSAVGRAAAAQPPTHAAVCHDVLPAPVAEALLR